MNQPNHIVTVRNNNNILNKIGGASPEPTNAIQTVNDIHKQHHQINEMQMNNENTMINDEIDSESKQLLNNRFKTNKNNQNIMTKETNESLSFKLSVATHEKEYKPIYLSYEPPNEIVLHVAPYGRINSIQQLPEKKNKSNTTVAMASQYVNNKMGQSISVLSYILFLVYPRTTYAIISMFRSMAR